MQIDQCFFRLAQISPVPLPGRFMATSATLPLNQRPDMGGGQEEMDR